MNGSLNAALLRAHKKILSPAKNSDNPFFKSRYADLDCVLESIRPFLLEEGIILEQEIITIDGQCSLKTIITHAESGEVKSFGPAIVPSLDIKDPQKVKSGVTYMRRTHLLAIFALAEVDDDGNEAAKPSAHNSTQKKSSPQEQNKPLEQSTDPSKMTLESATKELYACKTKAQATIACNRLKKFLGTEDSDKLHVILGEVHEKLTGHREPGGEG